MTNLRIAVVGIPGKWSTEVLADAIEAKTGYRLVLDMGDVTLDLQSNALIYGDINLCQLDGIMVKKIHSEYSPHTLDRLEMLRIAESHGVRVFSPASNILRLIDRLSCTVTLRQHQIPMPPTVITESVDVAIDAIDSFGEVVMKPLYSTKARGMVVLSQCLDKPELRQAIEDYAKNNPVMYIQKKLDLPGKDLGMVFLGGEYLGTYARVSQNEAWNTTILSGGKYQSFEASEELIALAQKAQAPFAMDFTTVDVAESEIGPIVFEVSAFGGFRGCKDGIGIDAASMYVDYAIEKIKSKEN